ncbi:MAG: major capsid protein [Geminicoccaceae bacterium]
MKSSRDRYKAYFFPVGVPGRFRQYNAPADFVETANTIGLPRYAKQAVDQQFARWVMLHVQSNPLPICTRPRVLIKGKRTDDSVRASRRSCYPAGLDCRKG